MHFPNPGAAGFRALLRPGAGALRFTFPLQSDLPQEHLWS
jgi:hypothetical protein